MKFKTHKDLKSGDLLYFKPNRKSKNKEVYEPFCHFVIGFQFENLEREIILYSINKQVVFFTAKETVNAWLSGSAAYYKIPEIIR